MPEIRPAVKGLVVAEDRFLVVREEIPGTGIVYWGPLAIFGAVDLLQGCGIFPLKPVAVNLYTFQETLQT